MEPQDNPAIHALARVATELDAWIELKMKNFNDLQYGKGDMRQLHMTCLSQILSLCAPGRVASLKFYHVAAKTWLFSSDIYSEILFVFTKDGDAAIDYSVCSNHDWGVNFKTPQAGFLVLARKQ